MEVSLYLSGKNSRLFSPRHNLASLLTPHTHERSCKTFAFEVERLRATRSDLPPPPSPANYNPPSRRSSQHQAALFASIQPEDLIGYKVVDVANSDLEIGTIRGVITFATEGLVDDSPPYLRVVGGAFKNSLLAAPLNSDAVSDGILAIASSPAGEGVRKRRGRPPKHRSKAPDPGGSDAPSPSSSSSPPLGSVRSGSRSIDGFCANLAPFGAHAGTPAARAATGSGAESGAAWGTGLGDAGDAGGEGHSSAGHSGRTGHISPDSTECIQHLVPLVPSIVVGVDQEARTVRVEPPSGLWDIGRRRLLLAHLDQALGPYKKAPNSLAALQRGEQMMPRRCDLLEAGRVDLVRAVEDAGGFAAVALELGLRARRRPVGYWENEDTLAEELALFVAANWTEMLDPESGRPYYYNQVTGRTRWTAPEPPHRIPLDDEGSYVFVEEEEDRAMPSANAVRTAGRYDLHQAILLHGGYLKVAEILERKPAWPKNPELSDRRQLRNEVRAVQADLGGTRGHMPLYQDLVMLGRTDLLREIRRLGGLGVAAKKLGFKAKRERNRWTDVNRCARELWSFAVSSQLPSGMAPPPCPIPDPDPPPRTPGRRSPSPKQVRAANERAKLPSRGLVATSSGPASQQVPPPSVLGVALSAAASAAGSDIVASHASQSASLSVLPARLRMPTYAELREAGREDLRWALRRHGPAVIGDLLGLELNRSHKQRGKGAKAAAGEAGGQGEEDLVASRSDSGPEVVSSSPRGASRTSRLDLVGGGTSAKSGGP